MLINCCEVIALQQLSYVEEVVNLKINRPIAIICTIIICSFSFISCSTKTQDVKGKTEANTFISIDNIDFFDTAKDVYVYFGRPTCPDCQKFEPELKQVMNHTNIPVYYFNTLYWKENKKYSETLRKYNIKAVPSLVNIQSGNHYITLDLDNYSNSNNEQKEISDFLSNADTSPINNPFNTIVYYCTAFLCFNLILIIVRRIKLKTVDMPVMLINSAFILFTSLSSIWQEGIYLDKYNLSGNGYSTIFVLVNIALFIIIVILSLLHKHKNINGFVK